MTSVLIGLFVFGVYSLLWWAFGKDVRKRP